MKYFPYFRGKQYELIAIREQATLIAQTGFVPIIEPVRQNMRSLELALEELQKAQAEAIIVVNPEVGELVNDERTVWEWLQATFSEYPNFHPGILATAKTDLDTLGRLLAATKDQKPALLHKGFTDARSLSQLINDHVGVDEIAYHVFFDQEKALYRREFGGKQVLVLDGFQQRKNSEYPDTEWFSELPLTYEDSGYDGFGDYLIVGSQYSEGGGPAYAVAIHMTYFNAEAMGAMFVKHFISDDIDTPDAPGNKFHQALRKLVDHADSPDSQLHETQALNIFRDLAKQGRYPGLGVVKKLSMQHHLETMAAGVKQ